MSIAQPECDKDAERVVYNLTMRLVSGLKIRAARIRPLGILFSLLMVESIPICTAARSVRPTQLSGYKVVPVHYGPVNKMIMSVKINGQPANLLVD